jgi:hypothetical protein
MPLRRVLLLTLLAVVQGSYGFPNVTDLVEHAKFDGVVFEYNETLHELHVAYDLAAMHLVHGPQSLPPAFLQVPFPWSKPPIPLESQANKAALSSVATSLAGYMGVMVMKQVFQAVKDLNAIGKVSRFFGRRCHLSGTNVRLEVWLRRVLPRWPSIPAQFLQVARMARDA